MWLKRDPVSMFASKLISDGIATAEQLQDMEQMLEKELDEAVIFAENSPSPKLGEATTDVYSDTKMTVDNADKKNLMETNPEQDIVSKYWEGAI